jgi:hypothetical protein
MTATDRLPPRRKEPRSHTAQDLVPVFYSFDYFLFTIDE